MRMCPSVFSGICCCFEVVFKSSSTFPRFCERAKWVWRPNSPKPRFCVNLRVNSLGKPYCITTPTRVNHVHRDPLSIRGCSLLIKTYILFCIKPICGMPIPHCGHCTRWPKWGAFLPCSDPNIVECVPVKAHHAHSRGHV